MEVSSSVAVARPRQLHPHWNASMIIASIAVSLLGAFTSTQIMCQARASRSLSGVIVWALLGSLTFGFCSIWSLHFIAMLACELDVPIGLDVPLTVLSGVLAVSLTFVSLSGDLIRKRYRKSRRRSILPKRPRLGLVESRLDSDPEFQQSAEPLLRPSYEHPSDGNRDMQSFDFTRTSSDGATRPVDVNDRQGLGTLSHGDALHSRAAATISSSVENYVGRPLQGTSGTSSPSIQPYSVRAFRTRPWAQSGVGTADMDDAGSLQGTSTEDSTSRRSSSFTSSDTSTLGLGSLMTFKVYKTSGTSAKNALVFMAVALYKGLTLFNIAKGFLWSIAITSMHYVGIRALKIPNGFSVVNPGLAVLSAFISWVVCYVGIILMGEMEVNLSQQLFFSVVAATGVSAMHFTGMSATTFWSFEPPSDIRGFPPELSIAIVSVAITTCIAASGLLAHSATVARNKLAEVVLTRKRLWAAIAQKENAEAAAAARSEFIASASHEIRTPLHQLQGYSDLLSRTQLSEEGRLLLLAIQHATKSLSMITSNVLDWSRLEKGEAICRPVAVDLRLACEAIINLLPNRDEELETDLLVVIAPEVPSSVFIDETYLHRILMNLLSNAFKFTLSGYVLLLVELKEGVLHATVRDTGFGIPQSFLPQLFEPFKQAQIRGAERGTGLGLSIIKQLLQRMQGDITVESKYQQDDDVGPANSGSSFTVTIPVSTLEHTPASPLADMHQPSQIAILHDAKDRDLEGLTTAWTKYSAEVVHAQHITDIPIDPNTIIWADLNFLKKHQIIRQHLLRQQQNMVIIPYDNQILMDEIIGSSARPHILAIRKPLIWHRILRSITEARNLKEKPRPDKSVRFAANVTDIVDHADKKSKQSATPAKKSTILLVEDNRINQKLGAKMLRTLGFDVLIAEDGQEAIEVLIEHDLVIDAILMDQSMPRMDGATATKEIRVMEAAGSLSKRRPIIAVTAVVGPDAQANTMAAGTDAFLPKPLSLVKLEQTLALYLKS